MRPFILNFASVQHRPNPEQMPSTWYDTTAEAIVFSESGENKYVMDEQKVLMMTGSHTTLQSNDPTRDEPTDR
jgi:hypothetical protein